MDAIESKISEAPEVAQPNTNPYTDPAQAAIYAAMSPADQAWATKGGGRPDLTDPYIAARAPNKFKPAAAPVAQAANPAPTSGAATTQAQADANRAKVQAALPANMSMNDFDAARNASEPEEPAAPQAANPAPAAPQAANPAPAAPQKQLLPVDPNIKAFQDEVLKTDPAAFARFGADGRKGTEVNNAIAKYPKIASKYKLAPTAPGTKAAPNQAANPAPAAGTKEIPSELLQKFPNPKYGQEVWHKGTRYKYTLTGGGRGGPATGSWKPTFQKGDWGWNQNQANAQSGYSDPAFATPQAANPVKEGVIAKALIESFGYTK
jgi:hypothetical protein